MCRSTHRLILRFPHFSPKFHHSVYPTSEHIILRRSCSPRHDVSCTKQRKGLDPVWPEIDTESSLAPHLYRSLSVALGISFWYVHLSLFASSRVLQWHSLVSKELSGQGGCEMEFGMLRFSARIARFLSNDILPSEK